MSRSIKSWVTAALLLGLLAALPATARAQGPAPPLPLPAPKVTPIQVTGPPSQRLNLIILGDGYQKDQQSLFLQDLDRNLSVMWATEPFRSYRNYINVYAVELASIDYGVRCDPDGRVRSPDGRSATPACAKARSTPRTPRCGCVPGERLHRPARARRGLRHAAPAAATPPRWRSTTRRARPTRARRARQAHNRILDTYVAPVLGIPRTSQNLQTLAIFNSFTYGGIGGTQATTSGGSPQGPLISLHEIGLSLGTFADEYLYFERDVIRPCYTAASRAASITRADQRRADDHRADEVVPLARRGVPLRRQDRPVGGRRHFPCGQAARANTR